MNILSKLSQYIYLLNNINGMLYAATTFLNDE